MTDFPFTVYNYYYFLLHKSDLLCKCHMITVVSPELSSNNDKIVFRSYELHTQCVRDRNDSPAKCKSANGRSLYTG